MDIVKRLIIIGEAVSVFAMILIFVKVIIIVPQCFNLFDAYVTILPIFLVKLLEVMELFK